jgi:hypothetical protein
VISLPLYAGAKIPHRVGDPLFGNVILLLHFEDVDGGSNVFDSSLYADDKVTGANASISSDQKKFGNTSLQIVTIQPAPISWSGTRFQRPNNTAFTIECWRKVVTSDNNTIAPLIFRLDDQFGTPSVTVAKYADTNAGRDVSLRIGTGSTNVYTCPVTADGFVHLAFNVDSSNNYNFYIEGVSVEAGTFSSASTGSCNFYVASSSLGASDVVQVYIDELRFTMGAERYPAPFTPPTAPFLNY